MKYTPIFKWFSKPYPLHYSTKTRLITITCFWLYVSLFLYIFMPFIMNGYKNAPLASFFFGFITFLITGFIIFTAPFLFPKFFDGDKWTTGKIFLLFFLSTIAVGTACWYYNLTLDLKEGVVYVGYIQFVLYTLLIGIFPIFVYLVFYEYYYRIKKQNIAQESKKYSLVIEEQIKDKKIIIKNEGAKQESISFWVKDLVYIRSQRNYVSFFLLNDKKGIVEKVVRITLNAVEKQLNGDRNRIIKCHRSFMINPYHFTNITGNARSYLLDSEKINESIPVSRRFAKEELKNLINSKN